MLNLITLQQTSIRSPTAFNDDLIHGYSDCIVKNRYSGSIAYYNGGRFLSTRDENGGNESG
jgi:hypothetical protein